MSIRLGSIVVDLTANTVSFSGAMDKASQMALNTSKQITRSLSFITAEAAAMATAVTGALEEVIRRSQDFSFEMQRAAEQTGTSSEMFSELAYNAKLAGVPVEMLRSAMERLARSSGSAQSGNKQAIAAYAALGISAKELNGPLRDSGDLFVAVAKKLDQYKDSTSKTYIEQKLLGRAGAELAPLLMQVASGFDTAKEQAQLFGVVIGDKAAAQARALHTSMIQLESIALGFGLRLLSGVSPALQEVAQKMVTLATSAEGMNAISSIASSLATGVRLLASSFEFLVEHITAVKVVLGTLAGLQIASLFLPLISSAAASAAGLESIGLVALKMIGRFSGISALAKVFTPLITSAYGTVTALISLASTEGIAATASYAFSTALGTLKTALMGIGGAATIATAGLAVIAYVLMDTKDKAAAASGGAATWRDVWGAALDQISNKMLVVKYYWDRLTGSMDAEDAATAKMIQQYGLLGQTLDQVAAARARSRDNGYVNYGNGESTYGHKGHKGGDKLDAPNIETPKAEKVDIVKLKLLELANAAEGAQAALANAGKNVDFERSAESATEATKIIDDLNVRLAAKGKALTDDEMATIRVAVATKNNDEAQAKFMDTIEKGTQSIIAQTEAHNLLTAAIGQGAAATRAAQVESKINEKYANASDTFKNSDEGRAKIAAERLAMTNELAAADANADKLALLGAQQEIEAQSRLNSVLLQGKEARDAVTLANQQAAITAEFANKGDVAGLQAALDANKQLFELKQKQTDLSKASSLNPAQQYRDEATALQDAAAAAREAGVAIDEMQLKAANKANMEAYWQSVDRATLAVGSLSDGVSLFFQQMGRDTVSAAQQIHDVLGGAFESLNNTIAKMTQIQSHSYHQFIQQVKNDFSEMFRSLGGQLAKLGLQKIEQGIAGSLFGKAADPKTQLQAVTNGLLVTSNSLLTTIAANTAMAAGGNAITGIGAGTTGDDGGSGSSGGSSGFGGFISKAVGSFLPMLFGGGKAVGGDVTAGMTYTVGEMGRETFTPTVNGKITPNNKLGNGGPTIHIDARNSNDPAQTEVAIHRAMQQYYGPGIGGGAVRAVSEGRLRRPPSARN